MRGKDGMLHRMVLESLCTCLLRAEKRNLGPGDFLKSNFLPYTTTRLLLDKSIYVMTQPPRFPFLQAPPICRSKHMPKKKKERKVEPPIQLCSSASNACTLNVPHQSSALHEKAYLSPTKLCIRQICKRILRRTMTACTLYRLYALR